MSGPRGNAPRRTAARLVWGSLSGPRLGDEDRALLSLGVGGVVLFARNVESPAQVRALVEECRQRAPEPLRVAVDQEGGHVARIHEPLTRLPSPMALGATRDARLAYDVARASAAELADLGIDVVLAPVLDVAADLRSAVVGARAFGEDPALVGRLGAATIRGYLDGGVLPVAKHFPGHGRTAEDSHLGFPVVAGTRADLETTDLPPFRAAVRAGAPALMTSHVTYTALGDGNVASLSSVATSLARGELGFDGLLVTDALIMDAVAHRRRLDLAAVDAVAAGADAVMTMDATWRCLEGIERAIEDGRLPQDRVADALARATAFALPSRATPRLTDAQLAAHARLALRVARRSLTLVDGAAALPLPTAARLVVVDLASTRPSPIENDRPDASPVAGAFRARFPRSETIAVDPRTLVGWEAAAAAVRSADHVVLATRDAFATHDGRLAVAALADERTIHVALRSPADLALPGAATRIAAYADTRPTVDALADALAAGPAAFRGRLPVTIPPETSEAAA